MYQEFCHWLQWCCRVSLEYWSGLCLTAEVTQVLLTYPACRQRRMEFELLKRDAAWFIPKVKTKEVNIDWKAFVLKARDCKSELLSVCLRVWTGDQRCLSYCKCTGKKKGLNYCQSMNWHLYVKPAKESVIFWQVVWCFHTAFNKATMHVS